MAKIDSVYDFTDKALVELKSWLEPWFKTKEGCECVPGSPSGDTIDAILAGLDPDGLWRLNETSGSTAHDSSGNGLDLTVDSGLVNPLWGQPAGPPGSLTADFQNGVIGAPGSGTGTNTRVSRSRAAMTADFTAGIFISRDNSSYTQVMGQGNPGRAGGKGWQFDISSNHPRMSLVGLGSVTAANTLAVSTWAMLTAVKNGTTWSFYVNGLSEGTLTGSYTAVSTSSPLWIGHDKGLGGNDYFPANFTGSYAFLIPSALSGAEILSIYNSAALPAGANEGKTLIATGLGGTYWDFASSGSGTTAQRPTLTANGDALFVGTGYFDTTLGKPIWWNGTVWKDATGTTV